MLNDPKVVEAIRLLDREISVRLRGTADESIQWADKLYEILVHLQECHRLAIDGLVDRLTQVVPPDPNWTLRLYLLENQRAFTAIMTDAFMALQIQDVTKQAIERACNAAESREVILAEASTGSLADRLRGALCEYIETDDLHRSQAEEAA